MPLPNEWRFLAERGILPWSMVEPQPEEEDLSLPAQSAKASGGQQSAGPPAIEAVAPATARLIDWRMPLRDASGQTTGNVFREIPIEAVGQERRLIAPEGSAQWTSGTTPAQMTAAQAGTYSARTEPITRLAELRAMREKRDRTTRENVAADLVSTGRSYWGKAGEPARLGRLGELIGTLRTLEGRAVLERSLEGPPQPGAGQGRTPVGVDTSAYASYVREGTQRGMTETAAHEYARKKLNEATGTTVRKKAEESVLGGTTGPAADAKVKLAAEQTAAREKAKLDYLRLPAEAQNRYTLYRQVERDVDRIDELFQPWMVGKGFQAAQGFAPLKRAFQQFESDARSGKYQAGALFGAVREWTGDASAEEVEFRQAISDAANTILYARSGAQINEGEFQRLKGALFSLWDEPTTFLTRLRAVRNIIGQNIDSLLEASQTPASKLSVRRDDQKKSQSSGADAVPPLSPQERQAVERSPAGSQIRKGGRTWSREQLLGGQ